MAPRNNWFCTAVPPTRMYVCMVVNIHRFSLLLRARIPFLGQFFSIQSDFEAGLICIHSRRCSYTHARILVTQGLFPYVQVDTNMYDRHRVRGRRWNSSSRGLVGKRIVSNHSYRRAFFPNFRHVYILFFAQFFNLPYFPVFFFQILEC